MSEYIIRTDAELRVENGRFTLVYDGSCVHTDMVKELPPHGRLIDADKIELGYDPHFGGRIIATSDAIANTPTILKANYEED